MSKRELNRREVLAQVDDGRLSIQNGANMLDVTKHQMFRLLKQYELKVLLRSGTKLSSPSFFRNNNRSTTHLVNKLMSVMEPLPRPACKCITVDRGVEFQNQKKHLLVLDPQTDQGCFLELQQAIYRLQR